MYRVGFPGWKLAARMGVPVIFRVEVTHDLEANVFVATSPDLSGLVAEGRSKEDLIAAVYDCTDMLMEELLKKRPKKRPLAAWTGDLLPA